MELGRQKGQRKMCIRDSYADDDPAFVCLPEQDQEKIQEFPAVSVIFRRAGGDIFPFQSEQV